MMVLILFSLAVWGVFRYSLEGHMMYNARRDLEHLIRLTEDTTQEEHAGEEGISLPDRLENAVQTEAGNARIMILNEKFRVIYPKNYDNQLEMDQLYTLFLTTATQKESDWVQDQVMKQSMEENEYLICYKRASEEEEGVEKTYHIILYCPVQDMSAIMGELSRLLLLAMGIIAVLTIVLFWFVAGSISGPVTRLSAAARGIGEKKFKKVETGATVTELCELENEINRMQEKLFQADQAERTFFQNASHELRTPLMSISGYAQGIQCGVFEDVSQAAGVILDESTRLTEVVDGILTLTRMDQSRYQIVPVELEINKFLEERLECLEGFAYSKNIKLVFYPQEEHTIVTDVMLLERAFSNVMSNCIRYAAKQVTVTAEKRDEKLLLTVKDDGPGLKESDLEHLFDRFYKGKGGNHGLGLAIARCSLEYMGASVEAASSPDGAVFLIILPQDCRSFAPEEGKELW